MTKSAATRNTNGAWRAGTVAYLSPGITVQVAAKLHLYGFVQLPIYSNLSGYQLFPHWTAAIGANYAL